MGACGVAGRGDQVQVEFLQRGSVTEEGGVMNVCCRSIWAQRESWGQGHPVGRNAITGEHLKKCHLLRPPSLSSLPLSLSLWSLSLSLTSAVCLCGVLAQGSAGGVLRQQREAAALPAGDHRMADRQRRGTIGAASHRGRRGGRAAPEGVPPGEAPPMLNPHGLGAL